MQKDLVTTERLQSLSKKFNYKLIAHTGRPLQSQACKYLAFNKAKANESYSYALEFKTEKEALAFVKENPDFEAFTGKRTTEYFLISD